MKYMKALAVLILLIYAFFSYILTVKGWVLYQALLGAIGLTTVASGLLIVPGIVIAIAYQIFKNFDKDEDKQ